MSRTSGELVALLVIIGALWLAAIWGAAYWLIIQVIQVIQPTTEDESGAGTCLCVDLKEKEEDCGDNDY